MLISLTDLEKPFQVIPFKQTDRCAALVEYLDYHIKNKVSPVTFKSETYTLEFQATPYSLAQAVLSIAVQLLGAQQSYARAFLGSPSQYSLVMSLENNTSQCQLMNGKKPISEWMSISLSDLLKQTYSLWQRFAHSVQHVLQKEDPLVTEAWKLETINLNSLKQLYEYSQNPIHRSPSASPVLSQNENFFSLFETFAGCPFPYKEIQENSTVEARCVYRSIRPNLELSLSQRMMQWLYEAKPKAVESPFWMCLEGSRLIAVFLNQECSGYLEEYYVPLTDNIPWSPDSLLARLHFFWKYWHTFKDGLSLQYGIISSMVAKEE